MTLNRKIIAAVMTLSLWASVASPAFAATADELQAQIDALLAQLSTLQSQLSTLTGGTATTYSHPGCEITSFDRNLKVGMTGDDVKCLQKVLNADSATQLASSGVGSPGNETSYFGPLTKGGVIKFQEKYASSVLAPWGLSAGTGFVGSTTRTKLNEILAGSAGEGGTGGTGGEGGTPVQAGTLNVSLDPSNPGSATVISDGGNNVAASQGLVPFLTLDFSVAAGTQTKVTGLKFKRTGISTDADISNVYLYEGDKKLAEMTSMSQGEVVFSNAAGLFEVGSTHAITLKADLNKDTTAGKTLGFSLLAASDVTTDASTVTGSFPFNGNLMSVAVVADFGRLYVASSTNSASVDPGKTFEAMRFSLTAYNQKIEVRSITFLHLGSAAASDMANIGLYMGGTLLGSADGLAADRRVTIDLSASPLVIDSGVTRTLSLKVDVIGGSTRTIQFSIQRATDIVAMDVNYNVYVQPDTDSGGTVFNFTPLSSTSTLVNPGTLTINLKSNSPSGNVALNGVNITLAEFELKAIGEPMKVSSLTLQMNSPGATGWTNIKNIRIVYEGAQVGITQNVITDGGTAQLSVNFTVPVGETKILAVKGDVKSQAGAGDPIQTGDHVQVQINQGTGNVQRAYSLGTVNFPSGSPTGNDLTVIAGALNVTKNPSVGNITTVYGAQDVVLGSFILTAGSAEGVNVSQIVFRDCNGTIPTTTGTYGLGQAFTNLKLYYGDTQLGSTDVTNPSDVAGTQYSFDVNLAIPQGVSIQVDLKGEVRSSPTWNDGDATVFYMATGIGADTGQSANIAAAGSAAGQTLSLLQAGTISAAVDPSSPETQIVVMGNSEVTLASWKLTANNVEDMKITQIIVANAYAAGSGNVNNLKMYCGSTMMQPPRPALVSNAAGFGTLSDSDCVVPKGGSLNFSLKTDITSYSSGASAGNYVQFILAVPATITGASTDTIIARGASNYAVTSGAGAKTANAMYPYRTSLAAAIDESGSASGRTRAAVDTVATLTLSGASASTNAQLRASLQADDENAANWSAVTFGAVAANGAAYIDGANSIRYTASTSASVGDGFEYDFTVAGLNAYTKASFWLRSSAAVAANDLTFNVGTTSIAVSPQQTTQLGAAAAATWTYYTVDLTGLSATSEFAGILIAANPGTYDATTMYIDNLRFYNDSILINVSGNLNELGAATGTAFYMKTSGGTTVATGYYTGTYSAGTVTLIPEATDISVGPSGTTYNLITNTINLMKADVSGVTESLSLVINLGGPTSEGDIRWWDQAATSPITWLNGTSPISANLGY